MSNHIGDATEKVAAPPLADAIGSERVPQYDLELKLAEAVVKEAKEAAYLAEVRCALWSAVFSRYESMRANGTISVPIITVIKDYRKCAKFDRPPNKQVEP